MLVQSEPLECCEDRTERPVDLADDVAVQALLRGAPELVRRVERHVRERVRQVDEERLIGMRLDECDDFFRVAARQRRLVGLPLDDRRVPDQGERRVEPRVWSGIVPRVRAHVVGVG